MIIFSNGEMWQGGRQVTRRESDLGSSLVKGGIPVVAIEALGGWGRSNRRMGGKRQLVKVDPSGGDWHECKRNRSFIPQSPGSRLGHFFPISLTSMRPP